MRFQVRKAARSVTARGAQTRLVLVAEGDHFAPPPGSEVEVDPAADQLTRALDCAGALDRKVDIVALLEFIQGRLQRMPAPPDEKIPVKGEAEGPGTFGSNFATTDET